jgi:hypothetical protein
MPYNYYMATSAEPILRSGLYVVRSFVSGAEEQAYVLYWPEDTTWDDQAVSTVQRNRVTFMRWGLSFISYCIPYSRMRGSYLTKLCDQLVCLLSAEHSKAIVWNDDGDDDDVSTHSEDDDSDRLYYFEVAKTNDQEENVVARPGFTVYIFITHFFIAIDSISLQGDLSMSCQSTVTAEDTCRPKGLVSKATSWRDSAGCYDS